jgi:hypothetical protein
MNETENLYAPPRAALRDGFQERGSLAAGIGVFFLCLLVSGVIAYAGGLALAVVMPEVIYPHRIALLALLLPWPVAFALAIRLLIKGRPRTALGMLVGFGILAMILLVLMYAASLVFALD